MQTSAKIKRRIRRLNAIEQASEGRRTPTPAAPTVMRLEAPHVPDVGTFNGDPEAWPPFRNLFLSEVHNRDMDDAKKLKLLKKACIDRAANTLGSWDLESDGYQAAWDRMLHVYNDDYHVVHGLLSRLFAMKRPERESFESMRLIVDTVNGAFRSLKTMSHHPALAEQIWVHIGKRALPTTALDAWEQHRGQLGLRRLPTLAEWTSFCDERSMTRRHFEDQTKWESKEASVGKPKGDSNKPNQDGDKTKADSNGSRFRPHDKNASRPGASSSKGNGSQAPGRPTACIMKDCTQNHNVWTCEKFRSLSLTDRMAVVRHHRLCNCCLLPGHYAYKCDRTDYSCTKCPDDKVKHHFRLCPKTTADKKPVDKKSSETTSKKESSSK